MIVEEGFLRVLQGPRENLHRPAIDPLFRSAAAAYGRRVIGVILTGMLGDGTAGLMVVSARGGEAIVQDPQSASFPSMPKSALDHVPNAHVLPLDQIAALLLQLISEGLPPRQSPAIKPPWGKPPLRAAKETRIAELIWMRFQAKIAWVIRRLSPVPIAVVCFGRLSRMDFFASAAGWATLLPPSTSGYNKGRCRNRALAGAAGAGRKRLALSANGRPREEFNHELPARLYQERASNTESNSKILRDFLLRVNLEESTAMLKTAHTESIPALLKTVKASINEHPPKFTAVTSHHGNPHSCGASYLSVLIMEMLSTPLPSDTSQHIPVHPSQLH